MRVRTHHDRATISRTPLTKEHGFHGLAEEPLTLFPDSVRCPLSAASPPAIAVALPRRICLGEEYELVGGGQGHSRGT